MVQAAVVAGQGCQHRVDTEPELRPPELGWSVEGGQGENKEKRTEANLETCLLYQGNTKLVIVSDSTHTLTKFLITNLKLYLNCVFCRSQIRLKSEYAY